MKFKVQPAKTAFMCILIICFAVVSIRTIRGPSTASGMTQIVPQPETQVIPVDLEMPVIQEMKLEKQKNIDLPKRNIFAVDPNIFPRQISDDQENDPELDARQMRFKSLKTKAQSFKIQSTMTGNTPTAFINETLVHENDVHNGFKVKKIDDASVTLEADGFTFVLTLKGEI